MSLYFLSQIFLDDDIHTEMSLKIKNKVFSNAYIKMNIQIKMHSMYSRKISQDKSYTS